MSGDVQPRRRKDKKKKKDDLGVEEPRGTAAVFGEGDVFIHSHHDHGTGGHWCAKIIFFSLLAVLVSLIGLIILENRGISEFEASVVESQYSGILEGWLEDAPEDDHHDEHTFELIDHNNNEDDDDVEDGYHSADADDKELHDSHEHDDESSNYNENEIDQNEIDQDENDEEDNNNYESQHEEDVKENDLELMNDEEDDEELYYHKFYENSFKHIEEDGDDEEDDSNPNDDEEDYSKRNDVYDNGDEQDDSKRIDSGENDTEEDDYNQNDFEDNDDEENGFMQNNVDENDNVYDDDNDEDEADENSIINNLSSESADIQNSVQEDDNDDSDEYDHKQITHEEENYSNDDNNESKQEEIMAYSDKEIDDDNDVDDESNDDIEIIEKDVIDEEPVSNELPALPDDDTREHEDFKLDKDEDDIFESNEDDEFLDSNDDDEPPLVEPISAPAEEKPLEEVDDDTSSEKPPDTLKEEEEYEKRQEELRLEKEQASHMWLKLAVGAALLVAAHALARRALNPATASHDMPETVESNRDEIPPSIGRRMTLITEEEIKSVTSQNIPQVARPRVSKEVKSKMSLDVKSTPTASEDAEEDEEHDIIEEQASTAQSTKDQELYSDEDEVEEGEEIIEPPVKQLVEQSKPIEKKKTSEPDEEIADDVEIIDDEHLEEELDDEEDDDEISDVDDAELLSRLEAKYGRLPEPERPGQRHKDGGNSIDWYDEPSDPQWRQHLNQAEEDLQQGEAERAYAVAENARNSGVQCARARWIRAAALDRRADMERSNRLLHQAVQAYLDIFQVAYHISDRKLVEISERALNRIQFSGKYLDAEPVYKALMRRFPNNVTYWNKLCESYLMANRPKLAEEMAKEIFKRWPDDRLAWAHYGFVLKTLYNKQEKAVEAFKKALDGDVPGPANQARFYYHLGDSLLLLGRQNEAHEVHKRGAKLGHFLSPAQRSLYNVKNLRSNPWWNIRETPYLKLAEDLERNWKDILKEGKAALSLYEEEKEGLKKKGKWGQLDLFVRGKEIPGRCTKLAPITCTIVRKVAAAVRCHRGQIKFSAMEPGTHVRPHVGPTNCRLRMHLGLSNAKNTFIRVDKETRQWQEGKVFMFDDSFEHEVWHNGTGTRLVLIVDVWHPDIPQADWISLPPI